jgi:dihydrofolate synthase/folylpolyglutamate synthase
MAAWEPVMEYREFLDLIYRRYSANIKLSLDRIVELAAELGSPQNKLSGFHVGGTNGKGSVCATLEALCLAHGFSTGLNTSPHLINYKERFRIDGKEPEIQTLLDLFLQYQPLFDKYQASFFEISTALAFIQFAQKPVDVSIFEVGLGGRLDATNVFTPEVAAITTIGLDHIKTLGNSVKLIAAEKAGIIKSGISLVLGKIVPPALDVILQVAEQKKVPTYRYGVDIIGKSQASDIGGITFDFAFRDHQFKGLHANLLGDHQVTNISTALACFILYSQIKGFEVKEEAVRHAIDHINWRGRMQVLSSKPPIILDGAHNMEGMKALVDTLDRVFPNVKPRFMISILADKDFSGMIELICSRASHVYVAKNQSDRAATVEDLVSEIGKYPVKVSSAPSVAEAYEMARRDMRDDDVLVCGGSLFTVGEVLNHLFEK